MPLRLRAWMAASACLFTLPPQLVAGLECTSICTSPVRFGGLTKRIPEVEVAANDSKASRTVAWRQVLQWKLRPQKRRSKLSPVSACLCMRPPPLAVGSECTSICTSLRCIFMETFFVFCRSPLPSVAVDCRSLPSIAVHCRALQYHGMAFRTMACHAMAFRTMHAMAWHGMPCHDMALHGMPWHDMQ